VVLYVPLTTQKQVQLIRSTTTTASFESFGSRVTNPAQVANLPHKPAASGTVFAILISRAGL
jgi:hypothetical protein